MNSSKPAPEQWVRQQSRWLQSAWPLAIAAIGLAATLLVDWRLHPSASRVETWGRLPLWWGGGLALTLFLAVAVWLARRRSLLGTAQRLDARLDAKNRLEAATALRQDPGALAQAQREETASFLHQSQLRSRNRPLFALAGLVAMLALAHLILLTCWTRPFAAAANDPAKATDAAGMNSDSNSTPAARLQWKSPESETVAAPIEEVPLEAVADSTSGLQDVMLEVAVNGEARRQFPLSAAELKAAGRHTIRTSIKLDELRLEAYDMVSYNLRAQRIAARKLPETASPIQFVEIKPPAGPETQPCDCAGVCCNYLTGLKAAQLRLMKDNFTLAHTESGQHDPDWKQENERISGEQGVLEEKTGEVVVFLTSNNVAPQVIALVNQSRPQMSKAAQEIQVAENERALAPQGKALALITEVEKYFHECVHASRGTQVFKDPFQRKQELKLVPKSVRLEKLAAEQQRLAEDISHVNLTPDSLNQKTDPDKIEASPKERQSQISHRLVEFLEDKTIAAEATQHLEQGRDHIGNSQRHLDEDDLPSAREPAAAAARELKLAAAAMIHSGAKYAQTQLADALLALIRASSQLRGGFGQSAGLAALRAKAAASQAHEAALQLADAAQTQLESGATNAAERLMEIARVLEAAPMREAMEKLQQQPLNTVLAQATAAKLDDLADQASRQWNPGTLSPQDLARLIDRLERAQTNVQRLAAQSASSATPGSSNAAGAGASSGAGSHIGDAGLRGQLAEDLAAELRLETLDAQAVALTGDDLSQLRSALASVYVANSGGSPLVQFAARVKVPLEGLIQLLRAELARNHRPAQMAAQQVEQAPLAYRPAVADYFERLSRDYQAVDRKAAPENK